MSDALALAAAGDLHCRGPEHAGRLRDLVRAVNGEAQALVLCGDLTDRGTPEEAKVLADALSGLTVPCAAVLGNHDFDHGAADTVVALLAGAGVEVLDGDHVILAGEVGVAGAKGFGGGFGRAALQAFGEPPIKAFVHEAVREELKLEAALSQLDGDWGVGRRQATQSPIVDGDWGVGRREATQSPIVDEIRRVVILHYAPVIDTLAGERPEIAPFLGTSRLAAPIDAYGASAVFHGHAHHGALEGRTPGGVPVYNVAVPLLTKVASKRFVVINV